jgi:trimeric autotransporter adhesin
MSPNIPLFVLYDQGVNADVSLEYSQGAFRFGHSQLRETIDVLDSKGSLSGMVTKYALEQAFLNPKQFAEVGPTAIAQGMTRQYSSEIDEIVTPSLQQSLLGQPQDLAAINIMRGRDLGLPALNALRRSLSGGIEADLLALQNKLLANPGDKFLQEKIDQTISLQAGLNPYASWNDFGGNIIHHEALINFIAAYSFDGDLNKAMTVVRLGEGGVVGSLSDRDKGYKDIWVDSPGDTVQGWTAEKEAAVIASLGWNATNAQAKALDFLSVSDTADKGFEKIDSWVGGLAEKHVFLGELGSTFDAIFADQMTRLINGDRFYYFWRLQLGLPEFTQLSSSVTTEQFKDVIERTTGAQHLTGNVFFATDSHIELGEDPTERVIPGDLNSPLKNANATLDAASHRYGDKVIENQIKANADGTTGIGVYSNSGYSNAADGEVFNITFDSNNKITGVASPLNTKRSYIRDTRVNGGDNPDGTPAYGFNSHETIAGTKFGDYIDAGDGDDTEYGGGGNDILIGNAGADHIYGEEGNDYIDGGDLPDFLDGGNGNDEIHGGNDLDVLIGGNGNDSLYGEAGADELQGGNGDDYLDGGADADFIYGGYGNDIIKGGEGLDTTFGEWGDDQMFGGAGPDQLFGGKGDDILHGGTGGNNTTVNVDECIGGEGFNIASYNDVAASLDVIADLNFQNINPVGQAVGFVQVQPFNQLLVDIQGLEGTGLNDQMIGDGIDNWLIGGGGNDIMSGGAGDDVIIGDKIRLDVLNGKYDANGVLGAGLLSAADKHFTDLLKSYKDFTLGADAGSVGSNDIVTYKGAKSNFTITTVTDASGNPILDANGVALAIRVVDNTGVETSAKGDLLIGIDKLVFNYDFETIATTGNKPHAFIDPNTLSAYDAINTVMNINDAPALTGTAGLLGIGNINTPYTIAVSTLLQGYTDADVGDTISVTGVSATNGTLALAADNINYIFTPTTGFNGVAKISYQVVDNNGAATSASKNLTIASFIEAVGNTSLVLLNGVYVAIDPTTNALTNIKYAGVNASPTSRPGWTIIGAEKNAAGVLGAIWKSSTGQYSYSINNASTAVVIPDITTYEAAFKQDLNGDGYITTYGTAGNDTLGGLNANEILIGGLGDDTYFVDSANDLVVELPDRGNDTVNASASVTLADNVENLNLTGIGNINGTGNALDNIITGNSGNNVLDGGAGNDVMTGGDGNDTYVVDSIGDTVVETNATAGGGVDIVNSSVTFTLGANVENLNLTGTGNINGTGNALDNIITGNSGNNVLDGGAGNDVMTGGDGNDTYFVDSIGDTVVETNATAAVGGVDTVNTSVTFTLGANVENLNLTGTGNINGTGNGLANNIIGNSGNNVLDGGAGNDVMTGGAGNDTYIVDSALDLVVELAGGGTDTINSSVTFSLAALVNVENLTLTGTAAINATGNALDNILTGNSANNVLTGGLGNDTYYATSGDTVVEAANAGTDTVISSDTFSLATLGNVENLTLTGTAAIDGTGNALANIITGNSGNNVLTGLGGNDTYYVTAGDTVVEAGGGGTDTVISADTFTLALNVENLTLTGIRDIDGTGNASANAIIGNDGNNILDGGAGIDILTGGKGNDTYIVDSTTDSIVELADGGTDTIKSSITFTLAPVALANIENLTLTGAAAINGTGNALANTITGNSANNTLNGGAGIDNLIGGLGNDTYIVDSTTDTLVEAVGEGTDTVSSSVDFSLANIANIENLTLTGTTAISATGNTLRNTITGNSANNILDGGAGADTLIGGAGNDIYSVDDAGDIVIENGGGGTDTVNSSVTYTLVLNVENLNLTGSAAIDGTGNNLANIITGNSANNILRGGAGADTFVLLKTGGGLDLIGDFTVTNNAATNEKLDVRSFGITNAGFTVTSGAGFNAANSANNLFIFDSTSKALYFDADGSGGASSMVQIASLTGVNSLTNANFLW